MKLKTVRGRIKSYVFDNVDEKGVNEDGFDLRGYANKTTKDRYDEVVDATAFASSLATYAKNPVMLYMHDPTQLIGKFPVTEIRHDGLFVKGVIGRGFEPADTARKQVEQGILKAMSIGFIPKKIEYSEDDDTLHIRDLELLEISLVSIPANQEALFQMDETGKCTKIVPLDDEQSKMTNEEILAKLSPDTAVELHAETTEDTTPESESAETDLTVSEVVNVTIDPKFIETIERLHAELGQAFETRISNVVEQFTSDIEALQATVSQQKRRISDCEYTIATLIGSEIQELARAAGIKLAS